MCDYADAVIPALMYLLLLHLNVLGVVPVAVGFLLGAGSTIHVESPLLREELLASSPKPTVRPSRAGRR